MLGASLVGASDGLASRPPLLLAKLRHATLTVLLAIYNSDQKAVSSESKRPSPGRTNWAVFLSDKWLVTSMRSLGFRCL